MPEAPSSPDESTLERQASQRDALKRSTPFRAKMYLIEADWSRATNREQALTDVKAAFQELKLPVSRESEFLQKAPEVLFGPTGAFYYSHDHATSLINWMVDHGLVKAVIESSLGQIKMNERVVSKKDLQKRSLPLSMQPGAVGLVIRDNTGAIPIMPTSEMNLGELTFRVFQQVWWLQVNDHDGMKRPATLDSKLFFEKKSVSSTTRSVDTEKSMSIERDSPIDYFNFPHNEVAFFNAFSIPQQRENQDSFQQARRRFEYAKQKGVLAVIAISHGPEATVAKPQLRLPDRVEMIEHDWGTIFSTVQLSAIDIPSVPEGYEPNGGSPQSAEVQSKLGQSAPSQVQQPASQSISNSELVNDTLEIVRKRYLEAEARTIALAQKQVMERVDPDVFLKAVAEAFSLRQEVHRLELDQLRGRTETLEQKIRARDAQKDQIIQRRVEELMKLGKDWQSMKQPDADLSVRTPAADSKVEYAPSAPGKAANRKLFDEIEQRLVLSERLQNQLGKPSDDRAMNNGTVIDMSDKRKWVQPSTSPPPIANQQDELELKKKQSVEHLQKLTRALLDYEKDHGRLPAAAIERPVEGKGTVRHSWRVEILPYLGQKELFDAYKMDEPWDSPANLQVLEKMPDLFASPLDSPDSPDGPKSTNTSYFAVVTPGLDPLPTPDDVGVNVANTSINKEHFVNGTVFSNPQGTPLEAITDGLHRTIALVELKMEIPWTQPLDVSMFDNPLNGNRFLWYSDGWHVSYVDGSVRQLSSENTIEDMASLLKMNDGDKVEPRVILPGSKRRRDKALPNVAPGQTPPLH